MRLSQTFGDDVVHAGVLPLLCRGMSLAEFKFIYGMEYAHRMWGRALGLIFLGPAVFFAARGWITRPLGTRLGILFAAGGCQGLVGWWMVKSGLQVGIIFFMCLSTANHPFCPRFYLSFVQPILLLPLSSACAHIYPSSV